MVLDKEQLSDRKTGIGSSDAAAALGLSPWVTPLELYLEKISDDTPSLDSDAIYWGNRLEDMVANEYALRTGQGVRRRRRAYHHPEAPLLTHIDRKIEGEQVVLECKTANAFAAGDWGEPGTDRVPEHYFIQAMHHLAVTGWQRCDIAVLIGGSDFRIYQIERNEALIGKLVELLSEFWYNHVERRQPPDPRTTADLLRRWPTSSGNIITITPQDSMWGTLVHLEHLRASKKGLESMIEEVERDVKTFMADAPEIQDDLGNTLVSWKEVTSSRVDLDALRAANPEAVAAAMKMASTRRFLLKTVPAREEGDSILNLPTPKES